MRTVRIRKIAADTVALRRESLASPTLTFFIFASSNNVVSILGYQSRQYALI